MLSLFPKYCDSHVRFQYVFYLFLLFYFYISCIFGEGRGYSFLSLKKQLTGYHSLFIVQCDRNREKCESYSMIRITGYMVLYCTKYYLVVFSQQHIHGTTLLILDIKKIIYDKIVVSLELILLTLLCSNSDKTEVKHCF